MSRVSAWRVACGLGRLATGGVRLVVDAIVIGGPWLYLPMAAGLLAKVGGYPWWAGTGAAIALGLFALADGKDGPSVSRFAREAHSRVEAARARAKARQVVREWPRLCERAGWATPSDFKQHRPVPALRFARTLDRRLLVAWRPPESLSPAGYGTHVEELRRAIGAHSADWRPVATDPGSLIGAFGLQALPDYVPAPHPVGGQATDPQTSPGPLAVHQTPRFVLGPGASGDAVWNPFEAPHLLVSGATGSGKGGATRILILQALDAGWQAVVIDGKEGGEYAWCEARGAELSRTGPRDAADALGRLERLMVSRGATLYGAGVERWQDFPDAQEWRPVLLVVDDAQDLLVLRRGAEDKMADQHRAAFSARLSRLAAQGRSVGVHLVVAVQRADATVISGFMRNNLPARLAVGALDEDGAEMMFGRSGRDIALSYLDGTPGRAVAKGLHRGQQVPSPVQIQYVRSADLGRVA